VTSLLLTTPYNHEAVHEQEMRKYEPIQAKLNANFAEQTKLLETIGVLSPITLSSLCCASADECLLAERKW